MDSVRVHAAALLVALIEAGQIDAAESFVDWALENLELNLTETFTEHWENLDA